ncbi:MAG: hypothetical protein DVB22_002137 [Verrucomicrobia bacterium]|nr:MAG: hypothetical protein DVB22_002137 [Verrucomicrobiota bacterium]
MTLDKEETLNTEIEVRQGIRSRCGFLLGCALIVALLMLPEVLARPLFGDDSYYLWAAKQIARGVYPYRDFFSIDPAGALAYYRLLLPALGGGSVPYWAMLAVIVLGTSFLLGETGRRTTGSGAAGIWAGFIFMIFQFRCTPAYGLMGKDMLAFPFVLAGLLVCGSARWWLLGHLLVGLGLAIKPTLGALWLVWMACDLWANREALVRWIARAVAATLAIGLPFLAATLWAESQGWGWTAFKASAGLRGSGYGSYLSGGTLYNLTHIFVPTLWMVPLAALGYRSVGPLGLARCRVLSSVLLGGLINWTIQPMFNLWYFVPFFGGLAVLSGAGVVRLFPKVSDQLAPLICCGLFVVFVPSSNLRWLKLVSDIKGKSEYTLVEHQSRVMAQYVVGNTPPDIQEWVKEEVAKLVGKDGRVGVLVTDGNLLWALSDYRAGFWAVWSPSWNPDRLSEGVSEGLADVIVGVDRPPADSRSKYSSLAAKLFWEMPEEAISALNRNYEPVSRGFGYVIYRKRR